MLHRGSVKTVCEVSQTCCTGDQSRQFVRSRRHVAQGISQDSLSGLADMLHRGSVKTACEVSQTCCTGDQSRQFVRPRRHVAQGISQDSL